MKFCITQAAPKGRNTLPLGHLEGGCLSKYFRQAIFMPYLNLIITIMRTRFNDARLLLNRFFAVKFILCSCSITSAQKKKNDDVYKIDKFSKSALLSIICGNVLKK